MALSTRRLTALGFIATGLAYLFIENVAQIRNSNIFWYLIRTYDYSAVFAVGAVIILAHLAHRRYDATAIFRIAGEKPLWFAIPTVILLALGAVYVTHDVPLCQDEYAAKFQAIVFASGRLTGQMPKEYIEWLFPSWSPGQFFAVDVPTGRVITQYLPGFAAIVAPFAFFGAPWLANPVIVGLTALVTWTLARELFGNKQAAGVALLLLLASPMVTVMGISYYAMPSHLLLNLVFAWLLFHPTPHRLIAAGFVGSWALVLHQPVPHLLFALPWIVWLAATSERRWRDLGCLCLGYLPVALLLGAGWFLWQQQFTAAPLEALSAVTAAAPEMSLVEKGTSIAQQLWTKFASAFVPPSKNILEFRIAGLTKVWLWTTPPLLILAVVGACRSRDHRLRLLAASAIITYFGYFFVPFNQGHGWGYRYFHSALGTLPLLAAAAIFTGREEVAERNGLLRMLALCVIGGLVVLTPLRVHDVYDHFERHLQQLPPIDPGKRQIVMMRGTGYYPGDLVQNDPFLRNRTIFMMSRMLDNEKALEGSMLATLFPNCQNFHRTPYAWVCTLE